MNGFIVVESARIKCEYGSIESAFLKADYNGCTIDDKNPILESNLDISNFLFCTLHQRACVFKALDEKWRDPAYFKTDEESYITSQSTLYCKDGGRLSIVDAGQTVVAEKDGMLIMIE
ncbi:PAAR-like protein [Flavobacterium sp. FlaQc-30]|uniref:PAAR-like protein n=1 Tax=Flavobacterium sp. FlaQc-30 TaxID=3374179 RepID=UPI003756BE2B